MTVVLFIACKLKLVEWNWSSGVSRNCLSDVSSHGRSLSRSAVKEAAFSPGPRHNLQGRKSVQWCTNRKVFFSLVISGNSNHLNEFELKRLHSGNMSRSLMLLRKNWTVEWSTMRHCFVTVSHQNQSEVLKGGQWLRRAFLLAPVLSSCNIPYDLCLKPPRLWLKNARLGEVLKVNHTLELITFALLHVTVDE